MYTWSLSLNTHTHNELGNTHKLFWNGDDINT